MITLICMMQILAKIMFWLYITVEFCMNLCKGCDVVSLLRLNFTLNVCYGTKVKWQSFKE